MVSTTGSAGTARNVPEWATGLYLPELEQLALRHAQYTEKHMMRGMFFTSTLECLRRARGEEAVTLALRTAALHAQKFSGMRNYPLAEFNNLRSVVGAQLQESLGSTEAAIASGQASGSTRMLQTTIHTDKPKAKISSQVTGLPSRVKAAASSGSKIVIVDGPQTKGCRRRRAASQSGRPLLSACGEFSGQIGCANLLASARVLA